MITEKASSDRLQWQKTFNALVRMLQTQQTQLESLVKERKLIEKQVQIQYDRWVSDSHLLEDQISQLKTELQQAEMIRLLEVSKSDLAVGLKQREIFHYKLKLENTVSDLDDYKTWFDYLTHKNTENEKSGDGGKECDKGRGDGDQDNPEPAEDTKSEENRSKSLKSEIKKLKRAYEKLTSETKSQVSALLSERDFVWNQFKKMESEYTSNLKNKRIEVEEANARIETLLTSMEQLRSSSNEKDETIVKLKANLAKYEADMDRSNKEISRLSKELELLRNSRGAFSTPVLNRCRAESSSLRSEIQNNCKDRRKPPVKKESAGSQSSLVKNNDKEYGRSVKRKEVDAIPGSDSPRLFSSRFKVPKLKNSSQSLIKNSSHGRAGGRQALCSAVSSLSPTVLNSKKKKTRCLL